MKKAICCLLILLLITFSLFGCRRNHGDQLWIVLEEHKSMELLVNTMIDRFREHYPNVEIILEVLPNGNKMVGEDYETARDAALKRLRTSIMGGKGPDVYLLPSTTTTYEMLFEDVNLAMRNYLFADISEYYDADTELEKDELLSSVMDAGVVDGARYILPLRYDMPVAYVDVAQFEAMGGSLDMFDGGIMELYKDLLTTGNSELAAGAFVSSHAMQEFVMNFCGEVINYDEREVQLSAEELATFMSTVQTVRANKYIDPENWMQKTAVNSPPTLVGLFGTMEHWTDSSCMYIGTLQGLMDNAAYAKAENREIAMIPVASADGNIAADVTYYGAVGNAADDTELAYEFLRLFLTEEGQWTANKDTGDEGYYLGWPVWAKGDISVLWTYRQQRLRTFSGDSEWDAETKKQHKQYRAALLSNEMVLTVQDLPILDTAVERVQFSIDFENGLDDMITSLNDKTTYEAVPADIESMAAAWLDEIKWHLAEG